MMIIGNTIKGKGVSFMENTPIWHYRSPTAVEYTKALEELNEVQK
jgi:transketolase